MATPQRQVRQLRVCAGSEAAARAMLPRLEDALRCASLPDEGGQLLLVRRLRLGAVEAGVSAQTLALAIESRFLAARAGWLQGEHAGDVPQAEQVVFAGAVQARVALVARLLRGAPCRAWYWARAVPEWSPAASAAAALAAVLRTLAQWPQARVALPAFVAGVAAQTGVALLARVVPEALGEACCAAAGLDAEAASARREHVVAQDEAAAPPRWLRCLLQAAGGPPEQGDVAWAVTDELHPPLAATAAASSAVDAARAAALSAPPATSGVDTVERDDGFWPDPGPTPGPSRAPWAASTAGPRPASSTGKLAAEVSAPTALLPAALPAASPWITGAATPHAGLLFLLPVLQRLGLPAWAAEAGIDARPVACAVLAAALQRLQAEPADPAWALCADAGAAQLGGAPAPASWHGAALAAPRGRPSPGLATALSAATHPTQQASCWLHAARRWLRRGPHIGLATLVRRPGSLAMTPTHADMIFRIADADLRLRRHGLDTDPGWLPWFGRVVAFHFRMEQR